MPGRSFCKLVKSGMAALITHYKQEHHNTCGLAAMRMLLSSVGESISEKDFLLLVKTHSYGIFSTELALPFLAKGLGISAYTFNLPVFGHLKLTPGAEITVDHLRVGLKTPRTKIIAANIKNYLQAGGKMQWHHPTTQLLEETLEISSMLVSVNTAALGDYWRHWNNGHYLVIAQSDETRFFVHDPYYDEMEGKYWIEKEKLIAAITVNAIRSTDYCMFIQ